MSLLRLSRDYEALEYEQRTTPRRLWVPCGRCIHCRKRRASDWRLRLMHECRYGSHSNAIFVTLTIAPEHYKGLDTPVQQYLRTFFDNYRTYFAGSTSDRARIPKHFFVEELGEQRGRLHLHGIIWDSDFYIPRSVCSPRPRKVFYKGKYHDVYDNQLEMADYVRFCWPYGQQVFVRELESHQDICASAGYIVKYLTDTDKVYDYDFYARIYCSPALGRDYLSRDAKRAIRSLYLGRKPTVLNLNGVDKAGKVVTFQYCVPKYYRDKSFSSLELRRLADRLCVPGTEDHIPLSLSAFGRTFNSELHLLEYICQARQGTPFRPRESKPLSNAQEIGPDDSFARYHRMVAYSDYKDSRIIEVTPNLLLTDYGRFTPKSPP